MTWLESRTLYVSLSLFFLPLSILCIVLCLPLIAFAVVTLYLSAGVIYLLQAQTDAKFNLPYNPARVLKINIAFLRLIVGWIYDIPLVLTYLYWRYWKVRDTYHTFVREDVVYSQDHPSCRLDVYSPERRKQDQRPVILFIYGGSWSSGSKRSYSTFANTLRELGYYVVVPDYRKYPLAKAEEMYEDVRNALRWLYNNCSSIGCSADAIYVMGHSAGAHLASQVVLMDVVERAKYVQRLAAKKTKEDDSDTEKVPSYPDLDNDEEKPVTFLPQVEGLLLLAGVYDIEKHLQHEIRRGVEKVSAMSRVMGSSVEGYRANSPIELIKSNGPLLASSKDVLDLIPRMMFIHGEKDAIVPVEQSVNMYNMFGEVLPPALLDEVDVRMRLYKRMGHAQCVTALMANIFSEDRMLKLLTRDIKDFTETVPAE